jgi:twitching motility protein PilT
MRVIPFEVPSFDKLAVPPVLKSISEAERGMVLVTGVTGSGKSTTMAAMLNHINQHLNKHIVTLENPIEFLHRDLQSSITQREIGVDTESFRMGLRAALRQDPDVVLIGEMRDAETIDTAMKAAETGHLLISTVHTPDAQSTVLRILAMFPPEEQDVVRVRLAESLHAVVSQRLLPRADGKGRVAALEIMVVTPTIRELMLDRDRVGEIRDFIADGREQYGMQTFDQHLEDRVIAGQVSFEVAVSLATNSLDFELQLRGLQALNAAQSFPAIRPSSRAHHGRAPLAVTGATGSGPSPARIRAGFSTSSRRTCCSAPRLTSSAAARAVAGSPRAW